MFFDIVLCLNKDRLCHPGSVDEWFEMLRTVVTADLPVLRSMQPPRFEASELPELLMGINHHRESS